MRSTVDYLTNAGAIKAQTRADALEAAKAELLKQGETKVKLALDLIDPNPFQPRTDFGDVEAMAQSLREQGQDYPVLVRRVGDRYQVADGETRLRAARLNAERHGAEAVIEAIVREYTDQEIALIAFRTAYTRKELTPLEEARGLQRLIDAFGLSYAQLGENLGKTKAFVAEKMRLLGLPEDIQVLLEGASPISPGQAIALGAVKEPDVRDALRQAVVEQSLPVAELRRRKELAEQVAAADGLSDRKRAGLLAKAVAGAFTEDTLTRTVAQAAHRSPEKPDAPTLWDTLKVTWGKLSPEQQTKLVQLASNWAADLDRPR